MGDYHIRRFKAEHSDERCWHENPHTAHLPEHDRIQCDLNKDHTGDHEETWESTGETWTWSAD